LRRQGTTGLRFKLAILCGSCAFITAFCLLFLVIWQTEKYNALAQKEVSTLIDADLENITRAVYNFARTENETIREQDIATRIGANRVDFTSVSVENTHPASVARVRNAVLDTKVGKTGYVFVLGGRGEHRGRYIVSQNGKRDGENIWLSRDEDGRFIVQEIIQRTIALAPFESVTFRYRWQNEGDPIARYKIAHLAYFAPWDWVIGTSVYEDELQKYDLILNDGRAKMTRTLAIAAAAIALSIGLVAMLLAWVVIRPIRQMTQAVSSILNNDFQHTVPVTSRDELGTLASAFNHMTTRLSETVTELRQSEERYRSLFENAIEGVFRTTIDGRFLNANPALAKILGYASTTELFQRVVSVSQQVYASAPDRTRIITRLLNGEDVHDDDVELLRADGTRVYVALSAHLIRDASGTPQCFQGFFVDISEQKRAEAERKALERQLIQAQKLQSIGLLAGGIAHDFNNILTPIQGFSDLLQTELAPRDPKRELIYAIHKAAAQGRALVRQLLAFGRQQILQVKVVDVKNVILEFERMIRRTFLESIELVVQIPDEPCLVRADTGQLEQILMNLAVNAQDAMPFGGLFRVSVTTMRHEQYDPVTYPDLPYGPYVVLRISDTGIGMAPETKARIFEPFFTTKSPDKGTGLGLASVFGIVKQHDGGIFVESELGRGTTFQILLPRQLGIPAQTAIEPIKPTVNLSPAPITILVVDDNEMVRNVCEYTLRHLGYQVVVAESPDSCLELVECMLKPPDLLLTDVIMPNMDGRMLYERVRQKWTEIPVLYMSAYPNDVIANHGILETGVNFLPKPLSMSELRDAVNTVLEASQPHRASPVA
jgi:PAS domain S-box-containing protein